jgi:cellulose biosynthesis protein BcsQ
MEMKSDQPGNLVPPAPNSCQVFAFVSAKGGSGKTLLTATAAYLLRKVGKSVLLIDTDFSTRGLTLFLMGPESRERHMVVKPEHSLSGILFDDIHIKDVVPRVIHRKDLNFNLILSSSRGWNTNKPDDRVVGDFAEESSGSRYFRCLEDLIDRFRRSYDYILIDTRGGYDFTSAAPAMLADGYAIVLEADQISVAQVFGLKAGIEDWGRRYDVRPALSGFFINKATFTLETRSFPDTLVNLYGGAHFGTIPLDYEAVRAYQIRDIPMDIRPDSDYSYHGYVALERLISPSLNWTETECDQFYKVGSQIRTLWRARRAWQFAERVLPAMVLVFAAVTAGTYIYVRNNQASGSLTAFYLSAAVFVLTSTLISAFVLLKNFQKWRIPRLFRIGLGVYGFIAAIALFWLTLVDVRRTFSKDVLISRIEAQNQLISDQTVRIASLSAEASRADQMAKFATADRDRATAEAQLILKQAQSKVNLPSPTTANQNANVQNANAMTVDTKPVETIPGPGCLDGSWVEAEPGTNQRINSYSWNFLAKGDYVFATRNDGATVRYNRVKGNEWDGVFVVGGHSGEQSKISTFVADSCTTLKTNASIWLIKSAGPQ